MEEESKSLPEKASHFSISDHVDKKKSAEEVENDIQVGRIVYILDRTIDKIKVMAFLPVLLDNDAEILKQFVSAEEVNFILEVCTCYINNFERISTNTTISPILNNIKLFHTIEKDLDEAAIRSGAHVSQVVDIIYTNKEMIAALLKLESPNLYAPLMEFAEEMTCFKELAVQMLSVSSVQSVERKKQLQKAYSNNMDMISIISDLKDQLILQRKELGGQLEKKYGLLTQYTDKMNSVQSNFLEKIKFTIQESERAMMLLSTASEERQAKLAVDAKEIVQNYQKLVEEHLHDEKEMRLKRFKVQTQLSSWLAKYDADIGERHSETEKLQKEFDDERAEMDALQEVFDEQEKEYDVLMQEKLDEEERIFNEKAMMFLWNRSARRIQRYWRAYRERKLARRRRRRKDKGKSSDKKAKGPEIRTTRTGDAMELLDQKFAGDIMDEIKVPNAFDPAGAAKE